MIVMTSSSSYSSSSWTFIPISILKVLFSLFTLIVSSSSVDSTSPYRHCFSQTIRRGIDNSQPIRQLFRVTPHMCMDNCIRLSNHAECMAFVYNSRDSSCVLFDHDGRRSPAIVHPANDLHLFRRIDTGPICSGPGAMIAQSLLPESALNTANFQVIAPMRARQLSANKPDLHKPIKTFFKSTPSPFRFPTRSSSSPYTTTSTFIVSTTSPRHVPQAPDRRGTLNTSTVNNKSTVNKCQPAYYVVIGNEIVLPISAGENHVKVFDGVDQADCARYCSLNQGPHGESVPCHSINYFPLTRKCELYRILAEPHGPGNLVENDEVIYAEKFCMPPHRRRCHSDEVFILHVQKQMRGGKRIKTSTTSITACLHHCLTAGSCKAASFDANRLRCSLHEKGPSESPGIDIDETDPGTVLIENGCSLVEGNEKRINPDNQDNQDQHWSEWSDCRFRQRGRSVRIRSRPDGEMQVQHC